MELVLAGTAIWLSLGAIKALMWLQQMPLFMSWLSFYKTKQGEEPVRWWTSGQMIGFAVFFVVITIPIFTILGPFSLLFERMRYFTPYGSAYVAGIAARICRIERGVEPLPFEEWEDYQKRLGDDPQKTAEAMNGIPFEKLPERVKDVIKVAKGLHDLQDRNVPEVDEEDEFRKDDE